MQHTSLGRAKSIAGVVLIGLGTCVLYEKLDLAASQLSHLLGASGNTLGTFPTLILAALRVLQTYAFYHQRFVQGLFQHVLVTLWPLLLVIAGTALSQDAVAGDAEATAKKDCRIVDLNVRRSTLR